VLRSFVIQGFRTFPALRVDRLGPVNLIVGKNGVGKTTLLEALRLYAVGGNPFAIRNLLIHRDEVAADIGSNEEKLDIASLFHGRAVMAPDANSIVLGPSENDTSTIRIVPTLLRRTTYDDPKIPSASRYEEVVGQITDGDSTILQALAVTRGGERRLFPVHQFSYSRRQREIGPAFVSATGADENEVALWWDGISLRDAETRVVECLNIVAPVERISLVEHPLKRHARMFLVRLQGEKNPIPLKSLGDGIAHMFQIALALEFARGPSARQGTLFPEVPDDEWRSEPMLLIDEAENGVHYTVLPQLWRFIFRVSRLHNVQVFATSHSWDCIEAFQIAAAEDPGCDGMLVRIERKGDSTKAVVVSEEDLSIVTREKIEVR